jgi:hypothetical protein
VRLLYFIFSLCIILLSVKPCCSDNECAGDNDTAKELKDNSKQADKDCKGCSPFFSCRTCTGFTITKQFIATLTLAPIKTGVTYPPYHQPNAKEISLSIWQPPQLV